ncbi:MAG: hypothetical protein ACYC7J_16700 [Syntrophales bacterium]
MCRYAKLMPLCVLLTLLALLAPPEALPQVTVHDAVSPVGREVMLRAETGSGLFGGAGGVLVEFFVDGRRVGKNLSGGDGVAFISFVPRAARLHKLRVEAPGGRAEGLLLAVKGSAGLVLIEVEGGLIERSLTMQPRPGSVEAVKKLSRRYPVVFLGSGFFGAAAMKTLLKERGFPAAPLIPGGDAVFEALREKRLKIRAVIGKPELVQAAKGYTRRAFSFAAAGEEGAVEDWEEILRKTR